MKFQLVAPDHEYNSGLVTGGINGVTVWFNALAQALRWHGHDAQTVSVHQALSADYVFIQSEAMKYPGIRDYAREGGKVICALQHFDLSPNGYPTFEKVRGMAWQIFTQWEGEVLRGRDYPLFPHAYNDLGDDRVSIKREGSIVFAGNSYSLRNESWFDGLQIVRVYRTLPEIMFAVYRGADVCVNLHGDFQKNIVSSLPNRVSNYSGMQVNERFWNVLGSGGLLITDWVPQMERWFKKEELIIGDTKEEFQELVKYYVDHKKEGLDKLKVARERIQKEHTYRHRVAGIFKYL